MRCPHCEGELISPDQLEMTCPTCNQTWRDCMAVFAEKAKQVRDGIEQTNDDLAIIGLLTRLEENYTEIIDELTVGGRINDGL
jgi:uncharacterized Zn ribbon protein